MKKGISFVLVLLFTMLAWLLLGYVLRLFFTSLSLWVFVFIGLGAGVLLGLLLASMHEVALPVSAPEGETADPTTPDSSRPPIPPMAGSSGTPGTHPHPQA